MAKKTSLPGVVILRNKLGTAIGVEVDGKTLVGVNNVNVNYNAKGVPEVTVKLFSQDIQFKDLDTVSAVRPKEQT